MLYQSCSVLLLRLMPALPGTRKNPTHPVAATTLHIDKVSLWALLVKKHLKPWSTGSEHSFNATVKALCENTRILVCWRREGNLLPKLIITAAKFTVLSWDRRIGLDNLFGFCSLHVHASMHVPIPFLHYYHGVSKKYLRVLFVCQQLFQIC